MDKKELKEKAFPKLTEDQRINKFLRDINRALEQTTIWLKNYKKKRGK